MEQAHELFRPPYLELPRALLQEGRPFLPTEDVKEMAVRCGFEARDWELGLRVAEQVFLLHPFP